jgi:hypothetical protein
MATQAELAKKALALKTENASGGSILGFPNSVEILDDRDVLLTRAEAAKYLRKSIPTLERWARLGLGPKPVKIQRAVHYRLRDLRAAGAPNQPAAAA